MYSQLTVTGDESLSACCIQLPDRFNQPCVSCIQLTVCFGLQAAAAWILEQHCTLTSDSLHWLVLG